MELIPLMLMKTSITFPQPFRRGHSIGMIAAALSLLPTGLEAGPKGTVNVRALGNKSLNMDGNIADWPLSAFTKVAEQPLFPDGQNATATSANGDHLVFDNKRAGLFNGTTTDGFTADGINDFGVSTYFAFDHKFLYILSVVIDNTIRDDLDTTQFGTTGFLTMVLSFSSTPREIARTAFPMTVFQTSMGPMRRRRTPMTFKRRWH